MRQLLLLYSILLLGLIACKTTAPKHFPVKYYKQHEKELMKIEQLFNKISVHKTLAVEFADKDFNYPVLEIKTDSLRYIYEFALGEQRMYDTLKKYGFDTSTVMGMVRQMKQIKCTWINKLDYYVDNNKQYLVYMSIRPKALDLPFSRKRYYILTFYKQPQYYDEDGRLLQKRNRRRLRKLNNEIYWRITDRVCYTLSEKFR